MNTFLSQWGEAAYTSVGFFWMALWAFAFGYLVSSMIQVLVTQERMQRAMGGEGARQVGLAALFGFISSSCSFAALATTKSLFKKGAGFVPSIAFLLASTNLVIELGVVIAVFLTWQFVVGEYVGGLLLIGSAWLFIRLTRPKALIEEARDRLGGQDEDTDKDLPNWKERLVEYDAWKKIGKRYRMEWGMVWKDVTVGFTIAGIVAVFIPTGFYETLFIGTGGDGGYTFLQILEHTLVGPVMAFITFIGSMGNIPLAAVLFDNGVSFAGVMAFIFSDLVVFPVLRINAKYYGWKMALYILLTLFVSLVATTLALHYGFSLAGLLPQGAGQGGGITDQQFFKLDYSFWLNVAFVVGSGVLYWLSTKKISDDSLKGMHEMPDKGWVETVLFWLAMVSYAWLLGGLAIKFFG
ncbi:permease [Lewinella sp. IMCC34183]|uniref:permease n=1 Tax=Lewinella sp. IMCC34183 TaxID=2248762 RepID=UPI000E22E6AF|nr:permease [Lewinella sp. IMCC34183]